MYVVCQSCGHRDHKRTMVVSRKSGRAWCRNERACEKRREVSLTMVVAR